MIQRPCVIWYLISAKEHDISKAFWPLYLVYSRYLCSGRETEMREWGGKKKGGKQKERERALVHKCVFSRLSAFIRGCQPELTLACDEEMGLHTQLLSGTCQRVCGFKLTALDTYPKLGWWTVFTAHSGEHLFKPFLWKQVSFWYSEQFPDTMIIIDLIESGVIISLLIWGHLH